MLKNIISLILPITVLIIVPWAIEKNWEIHTYLQSTAGVAIILIGTSVMSICITSFIRIGKGTLALWSPPKNFVAVGLYRYVRNPMILGVLTVLLGEAIVFGSVPILKWAGVFFMINTIYFFLLEEPQLEERFGDSYRQYKRYVNRWLPNFRPYQPDELR